MNIRDTGNADVLRVDPAAVRNNQPKTEKPPAERPAARVNRERDEDEYVQATRGGTGSALYSISDVRRGGRNQGEERFQEQRSTLTGKKIEKKVLDIILPPGVKNLKIFRTEQ